jgi:heterodisulfide reductase subunit C
MDYPPHQLVRGVQLGLEEVVLSSRAIWLCTACEACSTRCPQNVDPAGVIDVLRQIAYARGVHAPAGGVSALHRTFVDSVRRWGRVYEVGMMASYDLYSGHLIKDAWLALRMLLRAKLRLLPSLTGKDREVTKMFERADSVERTAG